MMTKSFVPIALFPLLLLVSCADPDAGRVADDGSSVHIVRDTVSGIAHTRTSGEAPAWSATRVARIGSEHDGPNAFGRIRSLTADTHGNVYVADNLASEIRVFDREGRHLRTIGRQGSGPGEFGDLYSLAWLGGQLAAMDPRNARIAIMSTDGQWVDGIRHFPMTGPASLVRLHPLGADGFYMPIIRMQSPAIPFVRVSGGAPHDGAQAGASIADTILAPQPPEGAARTGVLCHRSDGGITGIAVPQAPDVVYGFPPSGGSVAVAWTESYRIAWLSTAGDTIRVLSRDRPPAAYPDTLWNRAMEPYRELHRNFPGSTCEPSAPRRPAARAALRHIMFDDAGRMWVEAAVDNGFVWEIFDADDRLVGAAIVPPRATGVPPYTRDGYLYQVETDDLDVQYVAVYRVAPR